MKPQSKETIRARKKHWSLVTAIQDEFTSQYIHDGVTVREITQLTHLTDNTVKRFFHRGEAVGKRSKSLKPYSFLHGPYATTVMAIGEALGMRLKVERVSPLKVKVATNGARRSRPANGAEARASA